MRIFANFILRPRKHLFSFISRDRLSLLAREICIFGSLLETGNCQKTTWKRLSQLGKNKDDALKILPRPFHQKPRLIETSKFVRILSCCRRPLNICVFRLCASRTAMIIKIALLRAVDTYAQKSGCDEKQSPLLPLLRTGISNYN